MRHPAGRGLTPRLAFIGIIGIVLAACSGASSASAPAFGPASGSEQGLTDVPSTAASAAPSVAAPQDGSGNGNGSSSGNGGTPADSNLKIVYTGSLQMVVADVADAVARSTTAVAAAGGYIGASQESNDDQPSATITYRIPADKWEATVAAIRGVGTKVVNEQTQASDVGGQLVDLEARLANLRASEAALQKIAEGAANVNDLLQVQAQLTDVRGQIEEIDGQRAHLADQVAYGTLVTTFVVAVEQVKTAAKGWDPASDVDGATAAILSLGQHLVSGAIWFVIVWVPTLAILFAIAFVAWKVLRRLSGRLGTAAEPVSGWGDTSAPPPPTPPAG
jgi:hypothetical protein